MRVLLLLFLFFAAAGAYQLEFSVGENGEDLGDHNTVLIFGGIQGDEPGGFHAASLLLTDYKITKGRIIVAPNLAFDSIIKRSRGSHGDLNRKFASLPKNDPDYETVERIKRLVLLPEVSMVINLHDGWGFYKPTYVDALQNPKRWGNSSVIDTVEINASKYPELEKIAQQTVENVNSALTNPKHEYHIKNTKTEESGDAEMLKALTYFVISHHKAAFANEASKNLPVHLRVYYHLLAIENYLKTAGIEFSRDFDLTPAGVNAVINRQIEVRLFDEKILLWLKNPRREIKYVPFPVNRELNYDTSNELTAVVAEKNSFFIQYGNRFQTRLYPEYFEFSDAFDEVALVIDGNETTVPFGSKVLVKNSFLVPKMSGVRVNVIGFNHSNDESNIEVSKNNMQRIYSLDVAGRIYRVEFYELRWARLGQLVHYSSKGAKIIKNAPQLPTQIIDEAGMKDKFLGSILVEFEP